MLILVTTAHPQALEHRGPGFGRLVTPRHYPRVADTAAAGIPWAADNDCFQRLHAGRYSAMLAAVVGVGGCRFVAVPDAVGDAARTAELWQEWSARVAATGQPPAYVAQDGLELADVPWSEIGAVFVGGTTEWKLGGRAEAVVREARRRRLWVHMGRVNGRRRFAYARAIGCQSVDGSSFAQFRSTWLPGALTWHREHLQTRIPMEEP